MTVQPIDTVPAAPVAARRRPSGAPVYLHRPEPWIEQGSCVTSGDPDAWFPDDQEVRLDRARLAMKICVSCPVRLECLQAAIARDERHGIWGGMTTRQRLRLVRDVRKQREQEAAGGDAA